MKKSKNTESDLGDTSTPEKQPKENMEDGKKVEDDDEDFVVEEQHDEEDDNKNFELKFKSLRARTTVLPL
ncbi:hypothetical protein Tco_0451306 [Tanacetum coccineum]